MARRRRRRHSRRYGDYVSVPLGFGKLKLPNLKSLNPLGKSVSSTDVIVGAFVGLAGGAALRWALNKFWPTAPAFLQKYAGPITTVAAGAGALALMKNKHKAGGYFAGAALIGLAPLGWGLVQAQFPALAEYTNIQYGYPVDVGPMLSGYDVIVDEKKESLNALAAFSQDEAEIDNPYATFVP